MTAIAVKAKKNDENGDPIGEAEVMYDFGDNLEEMKALFGDSVVHSNAKAQMKVGLQAFIRRCIEAGKQQAEIAALVESYKPGVSADKIQDPVAVATAYFANLGSDEERAAFLEKLRDAGAA